MAVFTIVSDDNARSLLNDYSIGELVSLRGIAAGIENTNYFLTTTEGEFVLTVFEVLTFDQLPFYIELMHHLASRGVPVPQPQTRRDGKRISIFADKPVSIVSKLPGGFEPSPNLKHCQLAGETLARAHLAGKDFPINQPNLRGLDWWLKTVPTVKPFLTPHQSNLLQDTLDEQVLASKKMEWRSLPKGPSHCDLFRDNVLFDGTHEHPHMGGIIDFYFAGCDAWLFDVAVSVNDWCIERQNGKFVPELAQAWLSAYASVRPFTHEERINWKLMLKGAALRFWISRLFDYYLPRPAQTLKPHDPTHFERVLSARITDPIPALP